METYREMKKRHQDEFNKFPIGAAFTKEQFNEMMADFGLEPSDTDKILSLGAGAFIKKSDKDAFIEMCKRHGDELRAAQKEDAFLLQAMIQELNNYEFGYTGDPAEALERLGYTYDQVIGNERLKKIFEKAKKTILKDE